MIFISVMEEYVQERMECTTERDLSKNIVGDFNPIEGENNFARQNYIV